MARYAQVSNAKFNTDKSEAVALNGKRDDERWASWLSDYDISSYIHDKSPGVFRYLGFRFPFSSTQRKCLETELLTNIRTQCHLYSQRQLSIKGRVTVANVLILSKLWYVLRLFKPTKNFFTLVRSAIYQFVWQKKTPSLRKELIFLPIEHGGLQVLDPVIQHRVLQKRWLNYLFKPTIYQSVIYDYMIHHLRRFHLSSSFPLLPLFDKDFRKSKIYVPHMSIWSIIFDGVDYFLKDTKTVLVDVPLTTILALPLYKVLVLPPDSSHWSVRHPTFQTSQFMIYDNIQQRLRLRVDGEYSKFRGLCRTLYQDILLTRLVQLKAFIWPHILDSPSDTAELAIDWTTHRTLEPLRDKLVWQYFRTSEMR
ncbi:hypothetical protein BD770DRAFT_374066, partial [Pilaira anomala]